MTQFELLCRSIVFAPKCQRGCILYFPTNKNRGLCLWLSLIVFVSLSLLNILLWLSLFWARSLFLSPFALPSYATCRCWDYCCAYLVRCWILCMTLSCVPTVKRLIKHLYLPQIQKSVGSLLHLPLKSLCPQRKGSRAHLTSVGFAWFISRPYQRMEPDQALCFSGHPGTEDRILRSSERNCLVTKV